MAKPLKISSSWIRSDPETGDTEFDTRIDLLRCESNSLLEVFGIQPFHYPLTSQIEC